MKKPDAILKLTTGQKLYEQRARAALPILVRQALLQAPLTYGVLAKELQMPLARNLNYVLGIIGSALRQLGKAWGMQIPPLQCLVVNKRTGIPGRGIGWFITNKKHFQSLPLQQQRSLVHDKLREVCAFADWPRVLNAFGLKPAIDNFAAILNQAAQPKRGGESDEHKRLKEWVATHPALLKLPGSATSEQEALLPSGDAVDVLFRTPEEWIPVEVKSAISPAADIVRGLFQCIKYQAVIEAYRPTIQQPKRARAILVLGGGFPKQYAQLRDLLGRRRPRADSSNGRQDFKGTPMNAHPVVSRNSILHVTGSFCISSGGVSVVITKRSAQPFASLNGPHLFTDSSNWNDEPVAKPLVISLEVIMKNEMVDRQT